MAVQIQLRRGTASEWTSANPILTQGEFGYESDTTKFKVGDGTASWTELGYATGGGALTEATASATYLRQDSASATYLSISDALDTYTPLIITASATTSTTYTFSLNDANKLIEFNNASAITAVIPANSSVAFEVGTKIDLLQIGAGQVTASAEAGVTLNGYGDANKLSGQWAAASLVKRSTDTWVVIGNISA